MDIYDISLNDMNSNFFHFTKENNLKSISEIGLVPKIGYNARYIEQTKKVFFVEGLDNLLILFDCWINAYTKLPLIPFIYAMGARLIRHKWFPKIIADSYFKMVSNSKTRIKKAYKVFDKILDESVLLKLDLKAGVDFTYEDKDEIKARNYHKDHLIFMGYSENYSDINSNNMDRWNMHTLSNHDISSDKIKLCYVDKSYELKDIFKLILENTKTDYKKICPNLYDYLCDRKIIK